MNDSITRQSYLYDPYFSQKHNFEFNLRSSQLWLGDPFDLIWRDERIKDDFEITRAVKVAAEPGKWAVHVENTRNKDTEFNGYDNLVVRAELLSSGMNAEAVETFEVGITTISEYFGLFGLGTYPTNVKEALELERFSDDQGYQRCVSYQTDSSILVFNSYQGLEHRILFSVNKFNYVCRVFAVLEWEDRLDYLARNVEPLQKSSSGLLGANK